MRRARIVCTIGPASNDEAIIRQLIDAGMNVARLNFSHGSHDDHRRVHDTVRRVADKLLHEPTVRVKQLVNEQGAVSYAAALAELFALHPDAVEAVTRAEGLT